MSSFMNLDDASAGVNPDIITVPRKSVKSLYIPFAQYVFYLAAA